MLDAPTRALAKAQQPARTVLQKPQPVTGLKPAHSKAMRVEKPSFLP